MKSASGCGIPAEKLSSLLTVGQTVLPAVTLTNQVLPSGVNSPSAYPAFANTFNKEQRGRIEQDEALIKYLHYPSNQAVAKNL